MNDAHAAPPKRLWLLIGMVVITGCWMTFDGIHALVTGDFVTPKSGRFEGQLGPWAAIPRAVGIDPRSNEIKVLFVIFGLTYLASLTTFLLRRERFSWLLLVGCASATLLYLPFGSLSSVVALVVLATLRPRFRSGGNY